MDKLFIHVWLVIPMMGVAEDFSVELASIDISQKEQLANYCLLRLPDSLVWEYKSLRLVVWADEEEENSRPSPRAKWQVVYGVRPTIEKVLRRPVRIISAGATK